MSGIKSFSELGSIFAANPESELLEPDNDSPVIMHHNGRRIFEVENVAEYADESEIKETDDESLHRVQHTITAPVIDNVPPAPRILPDLSYTDDAVVVAPVIIQNTEDEERASLMEQVRQYAVYCGLTQRVIDNAASKSLPDLREYVLLMSKHAGGSVEAAKLIEEVENLYDEITQKPIFKKKMEVLDQRSRDAVKTMQQLANVLGPDVVINKLRFTEYHELLRHLVQHISVVNEAVSRMGEKLGVQIPVEPLMPNGPAVPLLEGQGLSTKSIVYILNILTHNLGFFVDNAEAQSKLAAKYKAERDAAVLKAEIAQNESKAVVENTKNVLARVNESMGSTAAYIVRNDKDEYVAKQDPEAPLEIRNVILSPYIRDAVFCTTANSANRLKKTLDPHFKNLKVFRIVHVVD